MQRQIYAV